MDGRTLDCFEVPIGVEYACKACVVDNGGLMWSKSASVDAVFSKGVLEVLDVVLQGAVLGLGSQWS